MVTYFYDCYQILNKVYANGAYLKQAIFSTFIEEKNRALTIKTVYGVLEKDVEFCYYISKLCGKNPKLPIRIVLKIAFYNLKYLNKKPYAVIDNAVSLIKKMGKGGVSGFVNAVLRKFCNEEITLPKDEFENLSIKYSYPLFAVKRLCKDYGKEMAENILKEQEEVTTVVFETDGKKYLTDKGFEYEETPYENAYFVKKFVRNEDYDKGVYTFQNIGSLAICDAVEKGKNLFDSCCAPGGKSIRLSDKFSNIVANELHPHRAELVKTYIERMHKKNITVSCTDATKIHQEYLDNFDAVLCDVPCSGFGVIKENPDILLNKTDENVKELCKIQLNILETVKSYLKKGGYLYYSTCSVFKAENIENVKKFLERNKEFTLEKIESKIPSIDFDGAKQFLPHLSYGAGFFVAKMKKNV